MKVFAVLAITGMCALSCQSTDRKSNLMERGVEGRGDRIPATSVMINIVKGTDSAIESQSTRGLATGKQGGEAKQEGWLTVYNRDEVELRIKVELKVDTTNAIGITDVYNSKVNLYGWNGKRLEEVIGDFKGKSAGLTLGIGFRYLNVKNRQNVQIKDSAFKFGADANWPSHAVLRISAVDAENPIWKSMLVKQ